MCSFLLLIDQFRRLGGLSIPEDDDYTYSVPRQTVANDASSNARRKKKRQLSWSLPEKEALLSSEEFMKRRRNNAIQHLHVNNISSNHSSSDNKILPKPIFVLNLPKSGTESSRDYFACANYESSHTYIGQRRIGTCLYDNWKTLNTPPLQGCNTVTKKYYIPKTDPRYNTNVTVEVYSDVGTPNPTCYYPTLHTGGLDYLYAHYPNATWVLFVRDEIDWLDSMKRWYNGSLLRVWKDQCGFPNQDNAINIQDEDWIRFYSRHTQKIRDFVTNHASLNYIEVQLEQAQDTLGKYTGIESRCWRHCLPGRQDDEKCVDIGEKHADVQKNKNTSMLKEQKNAKATKTAVDPKTKDDDSPPLPWSLPEVPSIRKNASQFMAELARIKHQHNISLPWEVHIDTGGFKLPTPIFILNLPKSGTQTITEYFKCGGVESSHTYVRLTRTGDCLRDNYLMDVESDNGNGTNPLQGCDEITKKYRLPKTHPLFNKNVSVETYSDIGVPYPGRCFYSSINDGGLDHIYKYYPNATIMLLTREVESWYGSASKWNNGGILSAWRFRCGFHGGLDDGSKDDWINFYHAHTEKIRNFAKSHLSMTYVEMELEDASLIDYYTGVPAKCFQHCLPGKKHHEMCKPLGGLNASSTDTDDSNGDELKSGNNYGVSSKKVIKKNKVTVDNSPPLSWSLPKVPAVQKSSKEFMDELATLKQKHNIPLPWEEPFDDGELKLPTPIFILNLPKSGTQTLTEFFKCGDLPSSHTYVGLVRTGDCLRNNYLADSANSTSDEASEVDPLLGCDKIERKYHIARTHPDFGKNVSVLTYSDIGTVFPGRCFYSSVNDGGLDHLYKHYPNATIMLLTREVNSWYKSISKWNQGRILTKWQNRCGFHGSIGDGSKEDWIDFYHAHTEKIRNFVKGHLSMTYVEMELEDASMIEHYTGIDLECFQHCLPGKNASEACKPIGAST